MGNFSESFSKTDNSETLAATRHFPLSPSAKPVRRQLQRGGLDQGLLLRCWGLLWDGEGDMCFGGGLRQVVRDSGIGEARGIRRGDLHRWPGLARS